MVRIRARRGWLLVLLAVISLTVTACMGGGGGSGSDDAGATEADAGPPQSGGTLRMAGSSDPPTIDPHKESTFNTHNLVGPVYSKLLDFKTEPGEDYGTTEIVGDLAESWEASEDGTTWTFTLRQGVQFQDVAPVNGREFTSADVACTVERIQSLPGQQLALINMVESVDTPDDYTVVFNLTEPFGAFDRNLAGHFMWMLPCEGTQGQFDLETQAIGTGPFILERWEKDTERVYVKHPNYFEEGKPYLDGFTYTVVPDQQAQISAFRTGELDILSGVNDDAQIEQILSAMDGVMVREQVTFSPLYVYMNQAEEPFDDIRVRRAVAMAVDRTAMMDALLPGEGPGGELVGPIPGKLLGGMPEDEAEELAPFDPDQAKALLAEAGFANGFETEMIVTNGYGPTVISAAQWVQQDLAEIGITVELDVQEYATYFAESWAGKNYQMGYGPQTPFLSADEYLSGMYRSDGPRNWFNINDPELDQMITEQRGILDQDEWEAEVLDIQRYIVEEISNPATTFVPNQIELRAPYVHDWAPQMVYGFSHLKNAWLGEDAPGRS